MPKSKIYKNGMEWFRIPDSPLDGEYCYLVYFVNEEGVEVPTLFKPSEVVTAMQRALDSPDAPTVKIGWVRKFLLKLNSLCR